MEHKDTNQLGALVSLSNGYHVGTLPVLPICILWLKSPKLPWKKFNFVFVSFSRPLSFSLSSPSPPLYLSVSPSVSHTNAKLSLLHSPQICTFCSSSSLVRWFTFATQSEVYTQAFPAWPSSVLEMQNPKSSSVLPTFISPATPEQSEYHHNRHWMKHSLHCNKLLRWFICTLELNKPAWSKIEDGRLFPHPLLLRQPWCPICFLIMTYIPLRTDKLMLWWNVSPRKILVSWKMKLWCEKTKNSISTSSHPISQT